MSQIRTDLKIIVVGHTGTGKTSYVKRWTGNEYQNSYKPTIGSEFSFKIHESKGDFYRIQLWDIGGQDKSSSIAKIFARDSHGCVVISDSTRSETLKDTLNWKKIISEESSFIDGGNLPFILVQNKVDLIDNREDFERIENETKEICENNYFEKYFMGSVKQNINVDESMDYLIENIIDRMEKHASNGNIVFNEQKQRNSIVITNENHKKRKKKKRKWC